MLWAQLLARIYEVLPLLSPACGGEMKIISFITLPSTVERILLHLDLRAHGRFRISSHPSLGTVDGEWTVAAETGGRIRMELIPTGGWSPGPAPRSANLLFRVVDLFRGWPATYRWEAVLETAGPHAGGSHHLDARWIRTDGEPPTDAVPHR